MQTESKPRPTDKEQKVQRPIRRLQISWRRLTAVWFEQHLQESLSSLEKLWRKPVPTLMTVLVIGIALALPSALYVITLNLERLGEGWEKSAAVSLFLKVDVKADMAEHLAKRLRMRPDIDAVTVISPEQALIELRAEIGFAEAVEQLEKNPLPYVLALRPAHNLNDAKSLENLGEFLSAMPEADLVRMDTLWVRRFQSFVDLGERAALVLACALALGVLLVVGNTIRLEIENHRQEIIIMETVGATPAFIRRPFLYIGAWYGLLGGLTSWLLIALARLAIQGPVFELTALYQSDFTLTGLDPVGLAVLLGGSTSLGLSGGWLSVSKHLAAIEPS